MRANHELVQEARAFARSHGRLYINGAQTDALLEATLDSIDPSNGDVWATVHAGGAADIDRAVQAAHSCFEKDWGRRPPADRERILRRFLDLLERNTDLLAALDSIDNGVVLSMLRTQGAGLLLSTVEYFSGWPTKVAGQAFAPTRLPSVPGRIATLSTIFEPIGVVGCILPWNAPAAFSLTKAIPALAAGCTVVVKPAEQTPVSALAIAELLTEAGLPAGAFNVVNGMGDVAGAALVEHPLVRKISFTGSTDVGRIISQAGGRSFKRMTLELGGKSAFIVMDDADIDTAAAVAHIAGYFLNGQFCMCPSRLLVERRVRDRFVGTLSAMAQAMRVGPSYQEGVTMGPLISAVDQQRVHRIVTDVSAAGAKVIYGGAPTEGPGFGFQPTLIDVADHDLPFCQEEIFGPVMGVTTFDRDDMDGLVKMANSVRYGLAASIWTSDLKTAHSLIPALQVGVVSINDHATVDAMYPFGGVKESGIGREFGRDGFESFFEKKSVSICY